MDDRLIIPFPGPGQATIETVGGKGDSLIRMVEAGLPVPRGVVLTTAFFAPWFDRIKASAAWAALADSTPQEWPTHCTELKGLCPRLAMTEAQRQALNDVRESLAEPGEDALFAVRSSSPEEDLASASFAGAYETRLGVQRADLDDAVRHCFASSLDERVLVYKRQHGFDVLSPRIAVVVQQQVDSEVAGVGFSLNPLTNDYDEAVIEANWGLGASVVAGLASPDHFVVDKVGRRIVETSLGAKQVSIRLDPGGGTVEHKDDRAALLTLSDTEVLELTDLMGRVEELYGRPMDIEWARSGNRLHLLQARPITRYVPLPPQLLTGPGERRRLYLDAALSKGMTTNAPISPMGLAWIEDLMSLFLRRFAGIDATPDKRLAFTAGGRMYVDLSNMMWLASLERLSKSSTYNDALLAAILANVDAERYRTATRPPWAGLRRLLLFPRLLWVVRASLWNFLRTVVAPQRAHRAYQRKVDAYEQEMTKNVDYDLPLDDFLWTYAAPMARMTFNVTMPALMAGLLPPDRVVGRKTAETEALVAKLKRGYTGNVVVEMGIALFRLAGLLDRSEFDDLDRLVQRIAQRHLPAEFLDAWDGFRWRFGCRGPLEMDLASPRYADDPRLALRQMSFMAVDGESFDPQAAHERQVTERRQAFQELIRRLGPLRRALLRRIHRLTELFAGTRDTPKHHVVLFNYALRKRALIEGNRLVREGRLDAPADVFDLTFVDLESAERDPSLDLRALRHERTRFIKMLETQVTEFPQVIDSRGRILRPAPRQEKPGELTGMPVSPGVATGPVKVLRDPHEKPVDPGDVLVAYTTDPGWTPLFVNAAAVLLEVGGVLQHGAMIAREYGKPCVAGIDRVVTRLHDGQLVEVDGTAGVIRILP